MKSLPVELLASIFRFAHGDEFDHCFAPPRNLPRGRGQPCKWHEFPKQPDVLSHVCSSWRRIALATSPLWSHIDIGIDSGCYRGLLTRAKVYAQRAASQPLEIHLCDIASMHGQKWLTDQRRTPSSEYEDLHEFEFLDADKVPIRSLALDILANDGLRRAHFSALEYFLTKCTIGELTQYIVRINAQPNLFIETTENLQDDTRINLLQLPESKLDERWRSVKFLDVAGLCPRWSSKLYHGLVDMRLGEELPEITELQFVGILKASPGLRILHLRNQITLLELEGAAVTRVQLSDLEVLNIEDWESHGPENGNIVRWIQPGTKPLRFTFFGMPTEIVIEFLKRSNVTRLYSRWWEPSTLVEMLRMAPRLQTLVLDAYDRKIDIIGVMLNPIDKQPSLAPATQIRIDTLYLLEMNGLKISDIQQVVNRCSIQKLFLWDCSLAYSLGTRVIICRDATMIQEKLSEITNCSVVEYLTSNDSPIDLDNWE